MVSGTLKAIALLLVLGFTPSPGAAQSTELDQLFEQLANPQTQDWQRVENQIWTLWSLSGSAAMDLLLARGREAMNSGNMNVAIEHFTALTDHAPDFCRRLERARHGVFSRRNVRTLDPGYSAHAGA